MNTHSFLPLPPFPAFRIFSEILVGEQKWGNSMFCVGLVGNLLMLVNFFWTSFKNILSILIWGHVQSINSLPVAVMMDHYVIHIFYVFLFPLSSIESSGFHSIFTIGSIQKCGHKIKGERFSVWSKESFLFHS